jgi:hypothetical protein
MHNLAVMANNQDIKSTPCDPVIKYVLQFMEMKWSKRNLIKTICNEILSK